MSEEQHTYGEPFTIHLHSASKLKAGDIGGSSDPFVRMYWKGDDQSEVIQSKVIDSTLFPVWDSKHTHEWKHPKRSLWVVEVWDKDLTGKDFLGIVEINVHAMTSRALSYPLGPRPGHNDTGITGVVTLAFDVPEKFKRRHSSITGVVKRASSGGASAMLQAHISAIEEALDSFPIVQTIADRAKVPRLHLFGGAVGVAFLLIFLFSGHEALCNFVGVLYPCYASLTSLRTNEPETAQWITYWVLFSTFIVLEGLVGIVFLWLPIYLLIKLAFLIWAMHPTTQGAKQIYDNFISKIDF